MVVSAIVFMCQVWQIGAGRGQGQAGSYTAAVPRIWDLVVVGAGPAGSAAALAALRARPRASVLLLDRASFPRDKVCGDGIAAHALDELAALGVDDPARGFPPLRRLRIRGPRGSVVAGEMARAVRVVPRRVLDARLVDAARAAGVEVRVGRVRGLTLHRDGVELDGGIRARAVVGADGANSTVRRAVGRARNPPGTTAVAVRGYASAPPGPPEQRLLFDGAAWPAYAWSFPVGDGTCNVGYGLVPHADRAAGRAALHGRLAELLPGEPADPSTLRAHHLPLSTARVAPARGRVLLAGDAASLVNPLTGEGIYYAVASGRLAGTAAVLAADPGAAYRRALEGLFGRHLLHTDLLARGLRSQRVTDAAVRATGRSRAAFDDMVELGLGAGRLRVRSALAIAAALPG